MPLHAIASLGQKTFAPLPASIFDAEIRLHPGPELWQSGIWGDQSEKERTRYCKEGE